MIETTKTVKQITHSLFDTECGSTTSTANDVQANHRHLPSQIRGQSESNQALTFSIGQLKQGCWQVSAFATTQVDAQYPQDTRHQNITLQKHQNTSESLYMVL